MWHDFVWNYSSNFNCLFWYERWLIFVLMSCFDSHWKLPRCAERHTHTHRDSEGVHHNQLRMILNINSRVNPSDFGDTIPRVVVVAFDTSYMSIYIYSILLSVKRHYIFSFCFILIRGSHETLVLFIIFFYFIRTWSSSSSSHVFVICTFIILSTIKM